MIPSSLHLEFQHLIATDSTGSDRSVTASVLFEANSWVRWRDCSSTRSMQGLTSRLWARLMPDKKSQEVRLGPEGSNNNNNNNNALDWIKSGQKQLVAQALVFSRHKYSKRSTHSGPGVAPWALNLMRFHQPDVAYVVLKHQDTSDLTHLLVVRVTLYNHLGFFHRLQYAEHRVSCPPHIISYPELNLL